MIDALNDPHKIRGRALGDSTRRLVALLSLVHADDGLRGSRRLTEPDAPDSLGCWILTSSGCPAQPSCCGVEWIRDGAIDESSCDKQRAAYDHWCGARDTLSHFVPEPPFDGGCWLRLPAGCGDNPIAGSQDWFRELNAGASADRGSCEAQVDIYISRCGLTDIMWHFEEPVRLRFYRFSPQLVRSGLEFQIAELDFLFGKSPVSFTSVQANGDFDPREPATNLIDGDPGTKACCSLTPISLTFPVPLLLEEFRFTTANDREQRDPLRWVVEGSADGTKWHVLHQSDNDLAVPQERGTASPWIPLNLRALTAEVQDAPSEPGCWILTPSGCPGQKSCCSTDWIPTREDTRGECVARAGAYNSWCKASNTLAHFVPDALPMQYFLFTPLAVRAGVAFEIAELAFRHDSNLVDMTAVVADGNFREGSTAQMAVDGNVATVVCCDLSPITLQFPDPVAVDEFGFLTGQPLDMDRSPVEWSLQGSADGEIWTLLYHHADAQEYDWFPLSLRTPGAEFSPLPPETPGCWLRTPSGCPKQSRCCGTSWRKSSASSAEACSSKRLNFDSFCGASDTQAHFVEPVATAMQFFRISFASAASGQKFSLSEIALSYDSVPLDVAGATVSALCEGSSGNLLDGVLETEARCEGEVRIGLLQPTVVNCVSFTSGADPALDPLTWAVEASKNGIRWELLHSGEVLIRDRRTPSPCFALSSPSLPDPILPWQAGCWIRTPSGCPAQKKCCSTDWRADAIGKQSLSSCQARRAALDRWCGAQDSMTHFVERPAMRYFQFIPTKLRNGGMFQISELRFRYRGEDVVLSAATATIPVKVRTEPLEGAENVIDNKLNTKMCSSKATVSLEFPEPVHIDEFAFATANDSPQRDPVRWELRGSTTGARWESLHSQRQSYPTTFDRFTWSNWFRF